MSANNVWYAKKVGNKWFGWDLNAEESVGDQKTHTRLVIPKIRINFTDHTEGQYAITSASSLEELEIALTEDSALGYAEYGLTTRPYLPKDGTPIVVIES